MIISRSMFYSISGLGISNALERMIKFPMEKGKVFIATVRLEEQVVYNIADSLLVIVSDCCHKS